MINSLKRYNATADFWVQRSKRPCPFLTTTNQKIFKKLLTFLNSHQNTKNQIIPLTGSWDTVNFRVLRSEQYTPIFDCIHLNISQSTVTFHELVSTCKKSGFFIIFSRDKVDLKILQLDWPKAFWPISLEIDFSRIWDLCKNTTNNTNFRYWPNSERHKD